MKQPVAGQNAVQICPWLQIKTKKLACCPHRNNYFCMAVKCQKKARGIKNLNGKKNI